MPAQLGPSSISPGVPGAQSRECSLRRSFRGQTGLGRAAQCHEGFTCILGMSEASEVLE